MTRKEVSKISPEAEKYCTELFDKSVNMGPYTPYGMVPSLVFPGSEGGGGWGGVATNPTLGLVFVNTRHLGVIAQLQSSSRPACCRRSASQKMPTNFYTDPQGYPCNAAAVVRARRPSARAPATSCGARRSASIPDLTAKGITGTGTALNDGGPIATASGLVFIGATGDFGFRAFDGKTGKELWKATLDDDVTDDAADLSWARTASSTSSPSRQRRRRRRSTFPREPSPGANTKSCAFALQ